jgi:hypothetical protein
VLREKDVRITPINTVVFSEMLKCMYRSTRTINRQLETDEAYVKDFRNETARLEALDFEDLAIGNCRAEREEQLGIDCDFEDCGFCGIERLFRSEE